MSEVAGQPVSRCKRHVFAVAAMAMMLLLLEGGARLALFALGAGAAPVQLEWEGQAKDNAPLRDVLYRPDEQCFFLLKPNVVLGQTPNPRIFDVRTNSLGLRGAEVAAAKPDRLFRVLCIGDSCTFGSGAGQGDTYPAQLEIMLRDGHPEHAVEVLNAGVPGFTSHQARRYLETDGIELSPDVVVVAVGFNDSMPAQGGEKRAIAKGVEMTDREYGAALRAGGGLGITRLVRRLTSGGHAATAPPPAGTVPASTKVRVSRDEYRENLVAIIDVCRQRGVTPVLVAWPIIAQASGETLLGRSKEIEVYQQIAAKVAGEKNVPFVDLGPTFAGRAGDFIDIVHMNRDGYGLVAKTIAAALAPAKPQAAGG